MIGPETALPTVARTTIEWMRSGHGRQRFGVILSYRPDDRMVRVRCFAGPDAHGPERLGTDVQTWAAEFWEPSAEHDLPQRFQGLWQP